MTSARETAKGEHLGADTGVVRGCGRRKAGAIYLEVASSPFGAPFENFICDPPTEVDAAALGISPIGVKLIEMEEVWHVFDIVGSEHYPNVADFIEEAKLFGVSRRLAKTLDFSKLTRDSKLILLHSRAYIQQRQEFWRARLNRRNNGPYCPRWEDNPDHYKPYPLGNGPMCAGLWWEDVLHGEHLQDGVDEYPRVVKRHMPAFDYRAFSPPIDVGESIHSLAIFASLPVGRIVVIHDPEAGTHEQAYKTAQAASLPVDLERE